MTKETWIVGARLDGLNASLIAALVFGMHVALAQLQGHGIHPDTRTQVQ